LGDPIVLTDIRGGDRVNNTGPPGVA
jgi:hypothetical protein